jgi:hypothetical protein
MWCGATNDTTDNNSVVMFSVSKVGGQRYADKIDMSNSSSSNSTGFEIAATNNNVIINWWETIFTSAEQVIIFSNDNGATFGPILKLAIYGKIGERTEEG